MDRKYNIRLDLQFRCNNSVMKFRQSDNKTSDFFMRITSDGDLFNIDNSIVILAVIKPDNTSQSQFLEVKEGKVYADLNSNMKDQVGIYKAQALLIYEDERVSTDVIEYEVTEDNILNQLQANVSTTEEFTMLQQMLSRLSTIEQQETQRELNESDRIQAEEDRVAAEKERVAAEDTRNHEEADRSKYEATRQSNENKRIDNENIRISAENKRIDNESIRVDNEESRIAAETERVNNYNFMTDDEARRRIEANSQAEAESLRVEAETERVNEEARRRTVEKSRVAAEQTREQNEKTRALQENDRVTAEQTRAQEHSTKIQSIDTTLKNLETTKTNLVKTVDDKVAEVNTKVQEVNNASTDMQNTVNTKMQEVDAAEQQRATDHQAREQFLDSFESQLAQIENKNIEQDAKLEEVTRVNKTQQVYINGLFNENKDGRLTNEVKGNSLKLEGSKEGLVEVDRIVGNTFISLYSIDEITLTANGTTQSSPKMELPYNIPIGSKITIIYTLSRLDESSFFIRGYKGGNGNTSTSYLKLSDIGTRVIAEVEVLSSFEYVDNLRLISGSTCTVGSVVKLTDVVILPGSLSDNQALLYSDIFTGLQSSFESNLVTQEMVNEGLESEENLGKYKVPIRLIGKNLFDKSKVKFVGIDTTNGLEVDNGYYSSDFIKIKPNTSYIRSQGSGIYYYDNDKKFILFQSHNVKSPTNAFYCRIQLQKDWNLDTVQIEEGTVATDSEDYFERTTNVYLNSPLLKNDEIVMKDGELCHYHKRSKVVLDGINKDWKIVSYDDNYAIFLTPRPSDSMNQTSGLICDKFLGKSGIYNLSAQTEGIAFDGNGNIYIQISISKLASVSVEGFNTWLQQNNVMVVYKLLEPYYEVIQADKLLLECANDSTLHIESIVPVESVSASYTGNVPSVYGLEETGITNTEDIAVTQTAVDFLLMSNMGEVMMMSFNENTKGGNNMGAYFASRIMKKALKYEDVIRKYPEFKEDIDFILRSEGHSDLIVEIQ